MGMILLGKAFYKGQTDGCDEEAVNGGTSVCLNIG